MFLKKFLIKFGIMLALIAFFGVMVYLVFQRTEDIKKEIAPTIESEYQIIQENKDIIITKLNDIIKQKHKELDSRNCKGFLYDSDKDGQYDKKVFDQIVPALNKGLVIKYNFCAYDKTKEHHYLVMFSTIKLINDFMKKDMGDEYVPSLIVSVDNGKSTDKEGLIASDILLEGL